LNGAVLLFAWYFLAKLLGAGHELKFLRYANLSFIFFSVLLVLVPVIFEDPVSRSALVELANLVRKEGVLALETKAEEIKDPFLKRAIDLMVLGVEEHVLVESLEAEIAKK
jgi:hypothetical protein